MRHKHEEALGKVEALKGEIRQVLGFGKRGRLLEGEGEKCRLGSGRRGRGRGGAVMERAWRGWEVFEGGEICSRGVEAFR